MRVYVYLSLSNTFLKEYVKKQPLTAVAIFESFKQKVLQIREKVEEFKDNHKMASQAISAAIDSMPEPFNKFFSVIWDGLEKEGEDGERKLLEIPKKIESAEQSFDQVKASVSELIQFGARTEDIQRLGEQIRISNESVINSLKRSSAEILRDIGSVKEDTRVTKRDINQKLGSTDLKQLTIDFYQHMKDRGTSQNYLKGNLKAMVHFAEHIGAATSFYDIDQTQIIRFLDTKIKEQPNRC
jgi:hypothetical protein